MYNDPQQELFTQLKTDLEALGYDVYDTFLPPEDTPYPFVYLGDFQQTDTELKGAIHGYVYPTIHIWHNNPRQRGTVSKMMFNIKIALRKIYRTQSYSWGIRSVNERIIPDNTTKTPLLHGVIEAGFYFS